MPRAQLVFEAAGINVIPFPVDFKLELKKLTFMSLYLQQILLLLQVFLLEK
jgi:uncharacterized SAM-binding protein YcdF (DUF218 family)